MIGAVNQIELLTTWLREWPKTKQVIVVVTGPTASGKTALWKIVTHKKTIVEFSGLSEKLPKQLERLKQTITSKTVADYVGMSYGKKPEVLIVEDAEMADPYSQKAIVVFARTKVLPVICVSAELPEKVLLDASLHLRMQRPPLDQVARCLLREADALGNISDFTLKDAKVLAESCNCDLRQARIELEMLSYSSGKLSFCDRALPSAFELVPKLFSSHRMDIEMTLKMATGTIVPMMIAENYHKAKGFSIQKAALAAEAISRGDTLLQLEEDMNVFSKVVLPCSYVSAPLESRPTYPILPAKMAAIESNRKRLPCHYDLLQPIETRIIKSLLWADPMAVVKEMQSLKLLKKMADWETIRTLAPIGRPPIPISPQKKDELTRCFLTN